MGRELTGMELLDEPNKAAGFIKSRPSERQESDYGPDYG